MATRWTKRSKQDGATSRKTIELTRHGLSIIKKVEERTVVPTNALLDGEDVSAYMHII